MTVNVSITRPDTGRSDFILRRRKRENNDSQAVTVLGSSKDASRCCGNSPLFLGSLSATR